MDINKSVWVRKHLSAFQVRNGRHTSASSPRHTGVCRRAVLLRMCFRTVRGFGCPHLTRHRATSCQGVRATALKRSLRCLTPQAQNSKEQPSECESRPCTGMYVCTQRDQQSSPNPMPKASSAYIKMRAGSEGGLRTSHPAPPSLPVCSFSPWGDFVFSLSWQQFLGAFTLPTAASSKCFAHLETISFAGHAVEKIRTAEALSVQRSWVSACGERMNLPESHWPQQEMVKCMLGVWGKAVKSTGENGVLRSGDLVLNSELLCFPN